ncbi:MAG: 16S rRNA (cytosine(1402)-N(4))-methyltransferase RsmH [Acidimicrobiia bacterium]|nr:16S rRNA (cytosine(1402)-N(4))-methyltransferase RsmH [Acidimicrobiia bacterium]
MRIAPGHEVGRTPCLRPAQPQPPGLSVEGPYSARFYRIPVGGLRVSRRFEHRPVLLNEVVEAMAPTPPGVLVDGTLGGGGHASALLRLGHLRLLGVDRDPAAVAAAAEVLGAVAVTGSGADVFTTPDGRVTLVRGRFSDIEAITEEFGGGSVSGVVLDLGVSSPQLDEAERGFGYSRSAVLDMRMDPDLGRSAATVIAESSEDELTRILHTYGEERFARRIARAIVAQRTKAPITTTTELAALVRDAIPAAARRTGPHPARRTFQALRIEVNDELGELDAALDASPGTLVQGGRMAVISYHSLEDRRVKRAFGALTTRPPVPRGLPVTEDDLVASGEEVGYRLLTRRPIRPTAAEVAANPRADSARMRVLERMGGNVA